MIKRSLLLFCFFSVVASHAQQVLSLDSAITIGLQNNYDILIARQDDAININNVYPGNAGMLPNVSLNILPGDLSEGTYNTKYIFSNGEAPSAKSNVKESFVEPYAELNWTLFDGFKMFATYNQLKSIRDQSSDNLKNQIQLSVSSIISAYYNVWYQKQLTRLQQISDSISIARLTVAKGRYEVGADSKLDYLQALVDYNANHSAFLKQQVFLTNSKDSLNKILARPINAQFDVNDALPATYQSPLDSIKQKVFTENPLLLSADKQRQIALFGVRGLQGNYYPKISLIGEYAYTSTTSQAGLILTNQSIGPSIGLAATWTLYNGSVQRRQVENAKIDIAISDLQYNNVKTELDEQVETAYNTFQNNLQLQQLELDNQSSTKEYLDLSLEQYKVGQISGLDFRTAQQSFVDEQTRLFTAEYNTQLSKYVLLELTGGLVK